MLSRVVLAHAARQHVPQLIVCVSQARREMRSVRLAVIVVLAVCLALGLVFVTAAIVGGHSSATALVRLYLHETARLVECAVARVTPLGPTAEDYEIYSAVSDGVSAEGASRPPIYLVTDWPEDAHPALELCTEREGLTNDIVRDFGTRNKNQWGLARRFRFSGDRAFVRPIDLAEGALGEQAEMVQFSRIGYDRSHQRALVYVAHYCPLCGAAYYVVVARDAQHRWSAVNRCLVWVS
jgi:hypothetical protein